ncbi:hypothetical protein HDU79_010608 [Rhizoclosmatium sp. JEL0117]|nr:hypothetical protein HDU79_010608 [Rhizoclosmatium sp. JEL0117]
MLAPSNSLAELGYTVNAHYHLVKLDGSPYVYNVDPSDRAFNQAHYEAIGDVLTEWIVEQLQSVHGLERVSVPVDAVTGEETSFVLMSPGALVSEKPLMLLIPGFAIQVGQWARKIVINESVYKGSMLEYVERAHKSGYNVLIFNSNENRGKESGKAIRGSVSAEEHVKYVWNELASKAKTDRVVVVAHSYGGLCIMKLLAALEKQGSSASAKIKRVALTDSVHSIGGLTETGKGEKITVNFVASNKELGTELGPDGFGVARVSAGTGQHEQTTVTAIDLVFKHLSH